MSGNILTDTLYYLAISLAVAGVALVLFLLVVLIGSSAPPEPSQEDFEGAAVAWASRLYPGDDDLHAVCHVFAYAAECDVATPHGVVRVDCAGDLQCKSRRVAP
jgi:hypothetical protein